MRQGAQGWFLGTNLRDGFGGDVQGGSGLGHMADSHECMEKITTIIVEYLASIKIH